MPGNTALSIACAYSLLHMIAPPRGSAEGLVGGGRRKVHDTDRGRVLFCRDEARDVCDICHTVGANIVGDLLERLEIDRAGVGRTHRRR